MVAAGGPFPGNNLWDATQVCANFGYRTLTYQGYTKDTIQYLSSDTDLDLDQNGVADDVDGDCTLSNLQTALTTWASAPVGSLPVEDVVVYLVDHGGVGTFRMGATETLDAADLAAWLNTLQAAIPGKLVVVYDACESGSFMSALDAPPGYEGKRIVLTSTSPGESAYFVTRGTVSFSNYFWTQIFNGVSISEAFEVANHALSQTFGYQHPLLDDTGDGAGNTQADGALASGTFIGNATRQFWEGPEIGAVTGNQNINGTSTATVWADPVTDTDGVARVWGVIRPPDFEQASSDNPIAGLPQVELFPTTGNRYEGVYQYFTTPGTYNILVYAMDRIGNVSAPELTSVNVGNPLKRKAVIVAGGSSSNVMWPAYEECARTAYEALKYQGYVDADIAFMSPVTIGGVDFGPSLTNVQTALNTTTNAATQDLTLCLIGPSTTTGFSVTPSETLTPAQLDGWLDTLQGSLPGKVTVVADASISGSYLPSLLPPAGKRIVVASTNASQSANYLRNGSISFSKFFWTRVLNGATVYEAYSYARAAMRFAGAGQTALLDDTGDGLSDAVADGPQSRHYYIGTGVLLAGDDPLIGSIVAPQDITGSSSATLWVEDVTTTSVLDRVWAVIAGPDGATQTLELTDSGGGHYEATHAGFTRHGTYGVAVFAQDVEGGVSAPKETTVSREDGEDIYEVDDAAAQARWIGVAAPDTLHQSHTFHDLGDADWVAFDALSGDIVAIECFNVGANAHCLAQLYEDDGTTLIDQDSTGLETGGAIIEYPVGVEGRYLVKVTNLLSQSGAGATYDLRVFKPIGPCMNQALTVNVSSTASGALLNGIPVKVTNQTTFAHITVNTVNGTAVFPGLVPNTGYQVTVTDAAYQTPAPLFIPAFCSAAPPAQMLFLTPVAPPSLLVVTPTEETTNAQAHSKTFQVSNAGGGTMTWTAQIVSGGAWLSFQGGSSGVNAGSFTVQHGKNESQQTRLGRVRVTAPGADGSGVEVEVRQDGDTTPPVVTVLGANPAQVNQGQTYSDAGATASDAVSGNVTSTISVTNPVNTALGGSYIVTYRAEDLAGNLGSATRTVTVLDTTAPSATLSSAAPSSAPGAISVDVVLSEASVNFAQGDLTASNATASAFAGSGTSYSFTLTPTEPGTFTAQVNAGAFTDNVANPNTASNLLSRTYNPSSVWVDMGYAGPEKGTQPQPYNSLAEAVAAVAVGGTVKARGNSAEHPRIVKALRLEYNAAPARIGSATPDTAQADTDADGLPDAWELRYGLDPKDPEGDNGPNGDPDYDGISNSHELADGSDPNQNGAKALPTTGAIALAALALAVLAYAAITNARRNRAK